MKAEGKGLFLSYSEKEMDLNGEKSRMLQCQIHIAENNEVWNIYVTEKFHQDLFPTVLNIKDYTPVNIAGDLKLDNKSKKPTFKVKHIIPING